MSSSTVLPARLGPPDTAAVPALAGAAADVFAALLFEHAVSAVPVASVNATSRAARRRGRVPGAAGHPGAFPGRGTGPGSLREWARSPAGQHGITVPPGWLAMTDM